MHSWGGAHKWKMGFDFSHIPFEGDLTNSPLGSWTFPKDAPYNVNDPTTYPTQYTNSLPTYANIPVNVYAAYLQDDWQVATGLTLNLGLAYDLQRGSFNEDVPGLPAAIQDKLRRNGSFPLDVSGGAPPTTGPGAHHNLRP